ncbi:DUF881 domain-containing protein [Brooklawnia cerclae]|uniref:Uncharacterized protein YlxW (UPF0749 family) n=1 Tax=Brooklawnia cerclae TaxID=349934 RepID=A0ABX0SPN4_9ACTN|nr:DUF881 domain-containing protein [Brooklawnia cerclae]NIH58766.1 uncharacterized protein YlxW (UPF0749 family) [Brooklawnia cerclae]
MAAPHSSDQEEPGEASRPGAAQVPAHPRASSVSTLVVGLLAGVLIGSTAITAQGSDLRPDRTSDLSQIAAEQEQRNQELITRAADLREQNSELAEREGASPSAADSLDPQTAQVAGLAAVKGPAVQVTLTDAPTSFEPPGVDADLLVVHEQDIQQVVNAMWAAGAEALTIQGVRAISTTAVKCVGNTVVLEGVPYAPPYVITAIGDQERIEAGLDSDDGVQVYKQYAQAYSLGYAQTRLSEVTMPAYAGALPQQATAAR